MNDQIYARKFDQKLYIIKYAQKNLTMYNT